MSTIIEDVVSRKIFNGRGEETIEVDVTTMEGLGRASAPAGPAEAKLKSSHTPKAG